MFIKELNYIFHFNTLRHIKHTYQHNKAIHLSTSAFRPTYFHALFYYITHSNECMRSISICFILSQMNTFHSH